MKAILVVWSVNTLGELGNNAYMSRGMRFPTMWQFDKFRLRRASVASF